MVIFTTCASCNVNRMFQEPDDLDRLYDEIGALTGDSDEWFDDDFGLGLKPAVPQQPGECASRVSHVCENNSVK